MENRVTKSEAHYLCVKCRAEFDMPNELREHKLNVHNRVPEIPA